MNRFVLCIIGWLMCFVSMAQQTSAETEQDESNKIIQVEFRSDPRSGDTMALFIIKARHVNTRMILLQKIYICTINN